MKPDIRILPDAAALTQTAAVEFLRAATQAVEKKGSFALALAGGSTPKALYSLLVTDPGYRERVPWDKTYFFFGDERHAGPDDPDSNFRMAREAMLSKVPLKPEQVFRIKGEYPDAQKAAAEYDQVLRDHFGLKDAELPRFDLVLLGMGVEGHTASLFPGTRALSEDKRLVVPNWVGKLFTDRITFTPPVLNNAARVIFLLHGDDKALALKGVLEGPHEPDQLPAQIVQPRNGSVLWLLDATAAHLLESAKKLGERSGQQA